MNPFEIPGILDNERFEAEMRKRVEKYLDNDGKEEWNWTLVLIDVELLVLTNMFYKLKGRDETIMDAAYAIADVVRPPHVAGYQQGTKFRLLVPAAEAQVVQRCVDDAIRAASIASSRPCGTLH